ncbi:MAG: hypothetical protein ABFD90_08840 [Phycisphaerales bacterium]
MKSFEEIEQMVKASRVLASAATDERILGEGANVSRPAVAAEPTADRCRRVIPIRIAAVVAVAVGLLVVLFPSGNGLLPETIVFADVQKAMGRQGSVHITGIRRCTFPPEANQPEEVYFYRTEKWASHAGYIDMTYEQDGTPVLQLCYHFDTGTITVTYHWLRQYYRLQVPQAYRDRLRGIGPVGLIETLFQSGDAKRVEPESVQGKDAIGFEVSNVAQRLDETVTPAWVRFFFLNFKESKVRLWIDPETRLPIHMQGDFWLQGCLFSDFTTMRMEETNDRWEWDSEIKELSLFPEKPEGYRQMTIPGAP